MRKKTCIAGDASAVRGNAGVGEKISPRINCLAGYASLARGRSSYECSNKIVNSYTGFIKSCVSNFHNERYLTIRVVSLPYIISN